MNHPRLLLITLFVWSSASAATAFRLTPENAVEFVYRNLKNLNLAALLPYCRGPEKKKLEKGIRNIRLSSSHYWAVKKQSDTMTGFRITRREVYEDVAVVTYFWKIETRLPVSPGSHLTRRVILQIPFELLLQKFGKKWYIMATRAKKPETEIGPYDYRQKMEKKYGKLKRPPRVTTF